MLREKDKKLKSEIKNLRHIFGRIESGFMYGYPNHPYTKSKVCDLEEIVCTVKKKVDLLNGYDTSFKYSFLTQMFLEIFIMRQYWWINRKRNKLNKHRLAEKYVQY